MITPTLARNAEDVAPGADPIEHNLLVIDDETEIVKALNRQFRRQYTVYTATSAEGGYEVMASVPIQVIISDQRMPGMSGSEFFSRVKHEYPDAIRLLLTGYADVQAVIAAINDGNIFRYITKPWDPIELDTIVRESFQRHDLIMHNRYLIQELQAANDLLSERVAERTRELSDANDQLRYLSGQKDKLMGMVVHDLRGPLGNIQMGIRLIRDAHTPPDRKTKIMGMVEDISAKMLYLINDLLDINAIESGRLVLEPAQVDIASFVANVFDQNVQLGEQKGIALAIDLDPAVTTATFDPKRIAQVLDNLIGNALKFSYPNTAVHLIVYQDAEALMFEVADQGQGIREEEIPRLFGTFQKTSTHPTAGESSSGLGLSICKRIVELHHGQIEVHSQIGVGTTFRVSLPV